MTQNSLEAMRASAGSGKTYALTTRYLRTFHNDVGADSILATTFTRKAAGEILGRVLQRLAQACETEAAANGLGKDLGMNGSDGVGVFSRADSQKLLVRLCRGLHRVQISTLDSFFSRLAQCFRYELDLPANAKLLEADSPAAKQLRLEAIHQVLTDEHGSEGFIGLLDQLQRGTAPRSVTEYLDELVNDLYETYRRAPDEAAWSRLIPPPELDPNVLEAAITRLADLEAQATDSRQHKAINQDLANARAADWAAFIAKGIAAKVVAGETKYYTPIPDTILAAYEPLVHQARAMVLGTLARQTHATFRLLKRYHAHYAQLRRERGLLLFADQPLALAELLPQRAPEEIAHRLDSCVDHLLLDEFQDTAPEQWAILKPFATRIAAMIDGGSLFCVGDLKQAIYGWRGGSAEIFNQLGSDLPGLAWEDNDNSYRSSKTLLDTVGRVFSNLPQNTALAKYPAVTEGWHGAFRPHTAIRNLPGYVEMIVSPRPVNGDSEEESEDEPGETAQVSGHEEFVATQIAKLANAAPNASIGVLMRKNDTVRKMIFLLQKLGVPASAEGGSPVSDDAAVEIVLSALTLADHPGDTAAVFHVLHSPLASLIKLKDQEPGHVAEVAQKIRRQLLNDGYAELISTWTRHLAPATDARGAQRLTQLVELADVYDTQVTLRPGDFVRAVRGTMVEEPSPSRIRVMTIHKSKGLEFDIVVLPELHGKIAARPPVLIIDRPLPTAPISAVYRYADEHTRKLAPEIEAAYQRQRGEEIRESLCLLYVAMTRARQALHLIITPLKLTKSGNLAQPGLSHAAILRSALAQAPDSGDGIPGEQILYTNGDPGWYHHLPATESPSVAVPAPPGMQITIGSDRDSRFDGRLDLHGARRTLKRVVPSQQAHGGRVDIGEILAMEDNPALRHGTIIHAWMAQFSWADAELPSELELLKIGRIAVPGQSEGWYRTQLGAFHGIHRLPKIQAALARPSGVAPRDTDLWRERSFTVRIGDRLISGIFDRVVVTQKNGRPIRAELMDFKTDTVGPKSLAELAADYKPQISAYKEALSAMLGIPPKSIRGWLAFVSAGYFCEV